MQFADIKNDIAFHKIFGNEAKKEILLSFLNAVLKLEGQHQLVWVEILNQIPIVRGGRSSVVDVKARDREGKEYIVEMQLTDKLGFAQRVVYYSAKSYSAQLSNGEAYHLLKPVIFIGILNFAFLENPGYISRHLILDADTHEHKLQDWDFNFIELPKFDKTEGELATPIDKWVYFIKNAENLTVVPSNVDDEGLKSAYAEADRHNWPKTDLAAYEYAALRDADVMAEKMLVEQKAELRKQIEIAKRMLARGTSAEIVAEDTGLTLGQIEQLRRETT